MVNTFARQHQLILTKRIHLKQGLKLSNGIEAMGLFMELTKRIHLKQGLKLIKNLPNMPEVTLTKRIHLKQGLKQKWAVYGLKDGGFSLNEST